MNIQLIAPARANRAVGISLTTPKFSRQENTPPAAKRPKKAFSGFRARSPKVILTLNYQGLMRTKGLDWVANSIRTTREYPIAYSDVNGTNAVVASKCGNYVTVHVGAAAVERLMEQYELQQLGDSPNL